MIYYTGDIHGNPNRIAYFAMRMGMTDKDIIVILGDVGANYYRGHRDEIMKSAMDKIKPVIFCVHGNHEARPHTIDTYKTKMWNGGEVWYEENHPNLIFAKDGEIYNIEGISHLVIGGAYSVDKHYRLQRGYAWWEDEQPSENTKRKVEQQIRGKHIDVILTHTCPFRYEPVEAFLPGLDQSTVDVSTEKWLDEIEQAADYGVWLCGHWHINKSIDKLRFLFEDFVSAEMLL
jgi:3-oxoacid CoA-transferase subunit A